jgi:hypothetical protein
MQCFYDSLTKSHRQMVNASCGGTFILKGENEAWTLFENLTENTIQYVSSSRRMPTLRFPKTECLLTLFEVNNQLSGCHHQCGRIYLER